MKVSDIRVIIRNILRESIDKNSLVEAQKSSEVNYMISEYFNNCKYYLNGEEILSEIGLREVKEECLVKATAMINQAQQSNFVYENFYVVKFGGFFIKLGKEYMPLTFEPPTSEHNVFKTTYTSFALYIYHDFIFKILPFNERMENDAFVLKHATDFVASNEFQRLFGSKTQKAKLTGEIKAMDFDRKNLIITNYFNNLQHQKNTGQEKISPFKSKNNYRPNAPFVHKLFGKGIIKSTKTIQKDAEGTVYHNIVVNFPRHGLKTIRVTSPVAAE